MKNIFLIAALTVAASSASATNFDEKYVSVNLTSANYDVPGADDRASGMSIAFGAKIADTRNAIEVGVADFGEVETDAFGDDIKISASTFFADVKTKIEVDDKFSGYTKIGLNRLTTKASVNGFSAEESKLKLMYGFGGALNLTSELDLTADFISYASDINSLAMGLAYKF